MIKYYLKLIFFIIVITLMGCADHIVESTPSIDDQLVDEPIESTFANIQQNIFNNSCAFSGCHLQNAVSPDLSGNSYLNIVNKQSSTGLLYIKPNDSENSYLLQKVLGSPIISGSRMPINSAPLDQNQIGALADWINNGAQNN